MKTFCLAACCILLLMPMISGDDIPARHWNPSSDAEETPVPLRDDPKLLILIYHNLVYGRTGNIYNRDIFNFEQDLAFLRRNFTVTEFSRLKEETFTTDAAVITFDDGDLSNYALAFPLLKEFGLKAMFFIVPEYVGEVGYMTWDQIREMSQYRDEQGRQLFFFGSHGLNHRRLGDLSMQEIIFELTESKRIIEEQLGQPVDSLALPYGSGSGDRRVTQAAQSAGYRFIRNSNPGYSPAGKENHMNLRALNVENYSSDTLTQLVFQLLGRQL